MDEVDEKNRETAAAATLLDVLWTSKAAEAARPKMIPAATAAAKTPSDDAATELESAKTNSALFSQEF